MNESPNVSEKTIGILCPDISPVTAFMKSMKTKENVLK